MRFDKIQDWAIAFILRFFNTVIWSLMWGRAYDRLRKLETELGQNLHLEVEIPGDNADGKSILWGARIVSYTKHENLVSSREVVSYSYFPGFSNHYNDTLPGFTLPRRTMETYDLLFDGWFRDMQKAVGEGKYKFIENIIIADCVFRAIDALEAGIAQRAGYVSGDVFGSVSDSIFGESIDCQSKVKN